MRARDGEVSRKKTLRAELYFLRQEQARLRGDLIKLRYELKDRPTLMTTTLFIVTCFITASIVQALV